MFTYQCRLSEKDYIDFNLFTLRGNPAYKRSMLLIRLVVPVMFAAVTAINLLDKQEGILFKVVFAAVITLIWELIAKPLYDHITLRTIKTQLKHGGSLYTREYTLTFDEDCLTDTAPEQETKLYYGKIERIAVHMGAVYVYPTSVTAMILPAAVFPTEADREALLGFLAQKRGDLTIERNGK